MNKIVNYLKDVYKELIEKTSWPTWAEVSNSARVVMIASVIIAAIVFLMDFVFEHMMEFIYDALY